MPFLTTSRLRRAAIAVAVAAGVTFLAAALAGEWLTRPSPSSVGGVPPQLPWGEVTLQDRLGGLERGWFGRGRKGLGAVLLLHGIHSNRRSMLARAEFLNARGFGVLLVDLRGHGESTGERLTFGHDEAAGVEAGLAFLERELPGERIGVIGVSLGGASAVLAHPSRPPAAIVLESVFPTIEDAVRNRLTMRLGALGGALAPLFYEQLPLRFGVPLARLHPVEAVSAMRAPLLVISGSADQRTTLVETRRLFDAAREPKELWIVEGADHVDLHAYGPSAYESRVGAFLEAHLHAAAD